MNTLNAKAFAILASTFLGVCAAIIFGFAPTTHPFFEPFIYGLIGGLLVQGILLILRVLFPPVTLTTLIPIPIPVPADFFEVDLSQVDESSKDS